MTSIEPARMWPITHAAGFYYADTINAVDPGPGLDNPIYRAHTYSFARRAALDADAHLPETSLTDCLHRRRSIRNWTGQPITAHAVDAVVADTIVGNAGEVRRLRPAPSAGACFPIETYLISWDVTGWAPGLRHLHVPVSSDQPAAWEILPTTPSRSSVERTIHFASLAGAAAAFVLSGIFDKARPKYGERSYRFTMLEAGHVAQNLLLGITCLRLGGYLLGGLADRPLHRLLDFDLPDEWPLYLIPFGWPATDQQYGQTQTAQAGSQAECQGVVST